ncbi:MAG: helix-turn-helix domain-containing protein [Paramuribaculum sp.]|nr:helix-turn-helix domain-containing protein [Paramuribaculum sp.]
MPTKANFDRVAVVGRIRHIISTLNMSQAAFARRLGVNPANLSKLLGGSLSLSEGFINRLVVELGVSKQWLVDGEGVPYPKPVHAATVTDNGETMVEDIVDQGLPVYDVDVTAGARELSLLLTDDKIVGRVKLPNLPADCILVRVSGDSMKPVISNGGFVAIRPVSSPKTIFWGQIYVIVLDDYRMIKYVRRHPDDEKLVRLRSANPDYDDIDVERSEIRRMFIVEAILNYDLRC